jgi:uncharacterized membrane protein YfcA
LTLLLFTTVLFCSAILAGILGALTGLGGGIVLIPILVLLLKVNMYYAMGASLIAVITTSTATSIPFLNKGYTNLKIGMFLETSAVVGALLGSLLILILNTNIIAIIFGIVLIISAFLTWRRKEAISDANTSHPWAASMQLNGDYDTVAGTKAYQVQNVPLAWGIMFIAGILSSLLGIGSGTLKVLAMDQAMQLPYKVSTATSNFIIGITASVSAGIYFFRGYIDPVITFPIAIGVMIGALTGAKIMHHANVKLLRKLFSIVIVFLAVQMIYKGLTG